MKFCRLYIVCLLMALVVAGCATGRQQEGKNPGSYHYQMGLSYLGEHNYTGALIELTEAEKFDPENPELLYNLGLAYLGKKRFDLAEQKLQQAILLKQNYSPARNDLGVVYLELKRWDNAIQQFKIVKDDIFYQDSESAAINLGLAYLGKGDYPKALEELRAVIVANPRNPVARLALGRVWFAMDKTEQAVTEYRKALEIFKEFGAAYYYLGLAQLKQNNLDAAKSSFNEVLRIIPDSELGHASIGYLELLK
ncbi:tetratricopeptide repeat protein [Oryzomonas japonica]|uniref:Tetratricopeptide repeat protein n=1 Tax=Oryzomonas japonica TaxID=2603858 RepID=A0A7J4ZNP8_9BACT|nr:tetratricopeptide repeat protein [Oryzomonas japonica]KAB0664374.1 tetratricopeptide repeat protein [Oryzomonas japonica]